MKSQKKAKYKVIVNLVSCIPFLSLLNCNAKFNNPTDGTGGLLTNYVFGLAVNSKPSILIKSGDKEYKHGDTITITASKSRTDFSQIFQIYNNTSAFLNLTATDTISVSGNDVSHFTVVQPKVTTLIPNSSTEFSISFKTEYSADKSAIVAIPNDDLTNSNFYVNLIGKYAGSECFSWTGSMGIIRTNHTATLLLNGKVLIAGGYNGFGFLSSAELYDPATGLFTATGSMGTSRSQHAATLLQNGKVLIMGGYKGSGYLSSAELYDPSTGLFTPTGSMGTARYRQMATSLLSGKVLVAGGYNGSNLSSAEVYDPATELFTPTGSMGLVRASDNATATSLSNGKVLVVSATLPELYDPSTGLFTATGSMGTARYRHTTTLLSDGKVLIAGGDNGLSVSIAEIFDPVTGMFTPTGSIGTARSYHAATLLQNGKVLITGGYKSSSYLSSAELYDPSSGLFTAIGSMGVQRQYHTTTLLSNGKVLVNGGNNASSLSSAELYDP